MEPVKKDENSTNDIDMQPVDHSVQGAEMEEHCKTDHQQQKEKTRNPVKLLRRRSDKNKVKSLSSYKAFKKTVRDALKRFRTRNQLTINEPTHREQQQQELDALINRCENVNLEVEQGEEENMDVDVLSKEQNEDSISIYRSIVICILGVISHLTQRMWKERRSEERFDFFRNMLQWEKAAYVCSLRPSQRCNDELSIQERNANECFFFAFGTRPISTGEYLPR